MERTTYEFNIGDSIKALHHVKFGHYRVHPKDNVVLRIVGKAVPHDYPNSCRYIVVRDSDFRGIDQSNMRDHNGLWEHDIVSLDYNRHQKAYVGGDYVCPANHTVRAVECFDDIIYVDVDALDPETLAKLKYADYL